MAHGTVEYGGGIMASSHEGIAEYIGKELRALTERAHYAPIRKAVDYWLEELEMPPGCSVIQLDEVLADSAIKELFVEALTEVHGALQEDQPRTKRQLRQVLLLLTLGEHALEGAYRPDRRVG